MLHDEESARDVVHDVFAKLLSVPGGNSVTGGYLLRAVRNGCLNTIRDAETRSRIACLYFLEQEDYEAEEWPDEATIASIGEIIASKLTPQARAVMQLRFGRGLAFAEVAGTLGISQNAVFKHLRRALITIRKNLSDNG